MPSRAHLRAIGTRGNEGDCVGWGESVDRERVEVALQGGLTQAVVYNRGRKERARCEQCQDRGKDIFFFFLMYVYFCIHVWMCIYVIDGI